jgi:c(7)-type cytochrome triheme protein
MNLAAKLRRPRAWPLLILLLCLPALVQAQAGDRSWKPLAEDGDHDPGSPAVELKQDPGEALKLLPPDNVGNQVRWVQALREGFIEPRAKLYPSTEVNLLDLGVLFTDTANMPFVLFPHRRHTEWLDCKNCHGPIFKEEAGTTPVNMFTVLMGEHCGRCHGAVAFPLTECTRCHSVQQDYSLLRRKQREMVLPGLSPYQDSDQIVLAKPKNHPMFKPKP